MVLLRGRVCDIRRDGDTVRFTLDGDGTREVEVPSERFGPTIRDGDCVEATLPDDLPVGFLPDGRPVLRHPPTAGTLRYRRSACQPAPPDPFWDRALRGLGQGRQRARALLKRRAG